MKGPLHEKNAYKKAFFLPFPARPGDNTARRSNADKAAKNEFQAGPVFCRTGKRPSRKGECDVSCANWYGVPNGTKLRAIKTEEMACLPTQSVIFPPKGHLIQPPGPTNMLNLVPLYGVPGFACQEMVFYFGRGSLPDTLWHLVDKIHCHGYFSY